jgi:hypothetical protein
MILSIVYRYGRDSAISWLINTIEYIIVLYKILVGKREGKRPF